MAQQQRDILRGNVTERQRDRETERQRDRETERQRDRETERQRDRETERQRDRETERQRDRETDRERDKICEILIDTETPNSFSVFYKNVQLFFTVYIDIGNQVSVI